MDTIELNVPANIIKSLLLVAGDRDIRYHLNGICLDMRTMDRAHLIATDGHRALIVNAESLFEEGSTIDPGAHYIIHRDLLEAVKPAKAGKHELPIKLRLSRPADTVDKEGRTVKHPVSVSVTGATTATGEVVDGRYPDVARVVPETCSGEPAQYDPAYVADFGKVSGLLSGKGKSRYITLGYNGLAAALVGLPSCGPVDAFGLLMPVRTDSVGAVLTAAPDWFHAVPAVSAESATAESVAA